MNEERLMTVLLGPHVSEKSTNVADAHNQVVFKVRRDANKTEVRRAVEKLFDVEVDKVRMIRQKGKIKRFGLTYGKRQDWKKAYVSLKPGQDIDFMGGD
ncbi:50S ribosomal protein L23 [Gammaproteobacteria bacterium AB-CW1]|uniref:Large ribosomal subunit protein uL23 n=1 Tax=Natronospira elongata TaxID=3110268 RepID=A0AAP6JDZ8_9GAMM|nr:50S ribosomal protein L23 [Gammaproteobacteria bacterium AB-CW1]